MSLKEFGLSPAAMPQSLRILTDTIRATKRIATEQLPQLGVAVMRNKQQLYDYCRFSDLASTHAALSSSYVLVSLGVHIESSHSRVHFLPRR